MMDKKISLEILLIVETGFLEVNFMKFKLEVIFIKFFKTIPQVKTKVINLVGRAGLEPATKGL